MNKITLAHLPTPLWHSAALDELIGTEAWITRDDMTSGAAAGNKIRKLEYLLGDALDRKATTILTCGGIQSNHARATAIAARELGMRSVLFLRTADGKPPAAKAGNVLLDVMVDAELRFVTAEQYAQRESVMMEAAQDLAARGERRWFRRRLDSRQNSLQLDCPVCLSLTENAPNQVAERAVDGRAPWPRPSRLFGRYGDRGVAVLAHDGASSEAESRR